MEPFWDLWVCRVSDACIQQIISLTSTTGRNSRVLLANVIPWINKASLALYIVSDPCILAMPQPIWISPGSCTAVSSFFSPMIEASKYYVIVEVESRFQTPSLWLRYDVACRQCTCTCIIVQNWDSICEVWNVLCMCSIHVVPYTLSRAGIREGSVLSAPFVSVPSEMHSVHNYFNRC